MTNLDNIYIAIVLGKNKEDEFSKVIKEKKLDFSPLDNFFIDRTNNLFVGEVDEILNEFELDFQDKTNEKELNNNNAILFIHKNTEDEFKVVESRLNPEMEYDWVETIKNFLLNVQDDKIDANGYWKWGQFVPEDGDYLCVDCGFVLELKEGDIFPICEVCLSGDPSSPDSKTEDGFWEPV